MPHSSDVAEYILGRLGATPAMKLQKLVYYCQAWSLVWDERPMITDEFQAWANGPVAPELYDRHRGQFTVSTVKGDPGTLDGTAVETIEAVLRFYGDKHSQWLSDLTHTEDPCARRVARCRRVHAATQSSRTLRWPNTTAAFSDDRWPKTRGHVRSTSPLSIRSLVQRFSCTRKSFRGWPRSRVRSWTRSRRGG